TTAPAFTATGANLALTLPPAEKSPISIPLKESSVRTSTLISFPLNERNCPADLSEAKSRSSPTGNSRSSNTSRICSPTAPVPPTTPTLYFSFFPHLSLRRRNLFPNEPSHLSAAHWATILFLNIKRPVAGV